MKQTTYTFKDGKLVSEIKEVEMTENGTPYTKEQWADWQSGRMGKRLVGQEVK